MSSSQCFENPPSKTTTCGAVYVEEFAGLNTYITGPPDSKHAIPPIADVFGYEAPNLSAILQKKLPQKLKDPGCFTIPCTIGESFFSKALCDLGASVNLMPLSVYEKLGLGQLKSTPVSLRFADGSIKHPKGKIEDVLVKVDKFMLPADFIVLAMEEDEEIPLILGRPFLATERTLIDVEKGELVLRIKNEEIVFNIFKAMDNPNEADCCMKISTVYREVQETFDKHCIKDPLEACLVQEYDEENWEAHDFEKFLDPLLYFCPAGYEVPNLRKLADKVAAAGFYVVVPDFFSADLFVYDIPDRPLMVWIKDHGTDKGFEDAKPVIDALKSKGIPAIGAAGCCWGAKVVVELAKSGLIQSAVLLHPSFVTLDDIKGVNVPIAILGAEVDNYSPPELLKQFEEILTAKPEVDSYVKIFPKVAHGWTVRYDVNDEAAVKPAEEAHANMLEWFTKYVK